MWVVRTCCKQDVAVRVRYVTYLIPEDADTVVPLCTALCMEVKGGVAVPRGGATGRRCLAVPHRLLFECGGELALCGVSAGMDDWE